MEQQEKHRIAHWLGAAVALIFAVGTGYGFIISLAKASTAGTVLCGILVAFGITYMVMFLWKALTAPKSDATGG